MKKYFYLFLAQFIVAKHSLAMGLLQGGAGSKIDQQGKSFSDSAGFNDAGANTASSIIASVIKVFLGFLGIIFIVLVIWSGYNWMTAGGNEEKVSKAKTTLSRAIIGLVITVSAYAITYFIFGSLDKATTGV